MSKKSRYDPSYQFRQYLKLLTENSGVLSTLFKQQISKETFNIMHPFGRTSGKGKGIRQISIRITDACNLRCHPCGQWGDNGYLCCKDMASIRKNEVGIDVYKRFIDEVDGSGYNPLWYLWGGEPMLYPHILDILKYLKEKKQTVAIVTNGTNIVKNIDVIMECVHFVLLSVDGPTQEIHNSQRPGVTSSINNFNDVTNAFKTIHKRKVEKNLLLPYVLPATCITTHNLEHIDQIYKLVQPYADMHFISLGWWIDSPSAEQHTVDFENRFKFKPKKHYGWIGDWQNVDTDKVYMKINTIKELFSSGNQCLPKFIPDLSAREDINSYYKKHEENFGYDQCLYVFSNMEINSNGDVSLCRDYNDYIIGNIKNQSLREIWHSEQAVKFRASVAKEGIMPVCRRCCGLMGF